jgi:hypothetical protein
MADEISQGAVLLALGVVKGGCRLDAQFVRALIG